MYTVKNYVFDKPKIPKAIPNGLWKNVFYFLNSDKVIENGLVIEAKLY